MFIPVGRVIRPLYPYQALYSTSQPRILQKSLNGPLHFYQNKQLELYASRKVHPLTLRQLVFFGKSMNEERLIKVDGLIRPVYCDSCPPECELCADRIARADCAPYKALPYVVVTREGVAKVYELYWSAFEKFRRYPQINTLNENDDFCHFLRNILDEHLPVIPNLYLGLSLASHHLQPDQLDSFMRRMLISRISRRVLAEHHLALSASFNRDHDRANPTDNHRVENLFPHTVIDNDQDFLDHSTNPVERWPKLVINGEPNTKFSYIKEHLEYIIFELLKNALRFTILHNQSSGKPMPIVQATIVAGPDDVSIRISDQGGGLYTNPHVQLPSDLFSFSHIRNAGRLDDVRLDALRGAISSPKGIKGTVHEQVELGPEQTGDPALQERVKFAQVPARIGIGLPMSNVYAGYFGGSLQLVPMDGWGTDAYVRLPRLGKNLEGIEV